MKLPFLSYFTVVITYIIIVFYSTLCFSQASNNKNFIDTIVVPTYIVTDMKADSLWAAQPKCKKHAVHDTVNGIPRTDSVMGPCKNYYAFRMPVEINMHDYGSWIRIPGVAKIWRLRIKILTAKGIQLDFDNFHFNHKDRLLVYSPDHSKTSEPLTDFFNRPSGGFSIPQIMGDEIIVEFDMPDSSGDTSQFTISHLGIVLTNSLCNSSESAASCENNVNCPTWNDWCHQIRSVVLYQGPGSGDGESWQFCCSGVLMNNTNQDYTPYIITACHCLSDPDDDVGSFTDAELDHFVFYFNYESPESTPACDGTVGYPYWTVSGCTRPMLPDNSFRTDLALLILDYIPFQDNVYYSGWNVNPLSDLSGFGTVIHHPVSDVKKISQGTVTWPFTTPLGSNLDMWQMNFTTGLIEEGSSGSPLFDNGTQEVIGECFGTFNTLTCSTSSPSAGFGMLMDYWSLAFPVPGLLSAFLAPSSTATSLEGIDPITSCQASINLDRPFYPAVLYREDQSQITIQVSNTITVAANQNTYLCDEYLGGTVLGGYLYAYCNYVLTAGSSAAPGSIYFDGRANRFASWNYSDDPLDLRTNPAEGHGNVLIANPNVACVTTYDCTTTFNYGSGPPPPSPGSKSKDTVLVPILPGLNNFAVIPNPFTQEITLKYTLGSAAMVTATLTNIYGQFISTLISPVNQNAGNYTQEFDLSALPAGIYIVRLTTGSYTNYQKIIKVKG